MSKILEKLEILYGNERAHRCSEEIEKKIYEFKSKGVKKRKHGLDEKDILVITYGDQFKGGNRTPLKNLGQFARSYLKDIASGIHILPFYPYSSDDGFSIIDYTQVGEEFGNWEDVKDISKDFRLMFDLVCNHISAKSQWFQGYLSGDDKYKDYFIEVDPTADLSSVVRPRALPLLTAFDTKKGTKYVWTTFSEDQIDLNYSNEQVLLSIVDVLLYYVEKGADLIRLDAVGFLWKEIGTTCIHLKETHTVIQLFKVILEQAAPWVILVTETNVPHEYNISYFGNGYNEAKMVYQFPLPPLILYTLVKEDTSILSKWAKGLKPVSDETTFFNFLASHDGIGLNPVRGIITEEDIEEMVQKVKERGGYVSYKNNPDGSQSPYELNISYLNAISDVEESEDVRIKKFTACHAIIMSIIGVPGIYIHSILGSQNYHEGVKITGRYRSINREKFQVDAIESELSEKEVLRSRIYISLKQIAKIRRAQKAFHPNALQKVIFTDRRVLSLFRISAENGETIAAIHNVSGDVVDIKVDLEAYNLNAFEAKDLIKNIDVKIENNKLKTKLDAYEFVWLKLIGSK